MINERGKQRGISMKKKTRASATKIEKGRRGIRKGPERIMFGKIVGRLSQVLTFREMQLLEYGATAETSTNKANLCSSR